MSDRLKSNETLKVGEYIQSQNKKFFCIMQSDGNLCVWNGAPGEGNKFIKWSSFWSKNYELESSQQHIMCMQSDGNLTINCEGNFKWGCYQACGTPLFYSPDYVLWMQNDGNLCIREGDFAGPGDKFIWGSWQDMSKKGYAYELYKD